MSDQVPEEVSMVVGPEFRREAAEQLNQLSEELLKNGKNVGFFQQLLALSPPQVVAIVACSIAAKEMLPHAAKAFVKALPLAGKGTKMMIGYKTDHENNIMINVENEVELIKLGKRAKFGELVKVTYGALQNPKVQKAVAISALVTGTTGVILYSAFKMNKQIKDVVDYNDKLDSIINSSIKRKVDVSTKSAFEIRQMETELMKKGEQEKWLDENINVILDERLKELANEK